MSRLVPLTAAALVATAALAAAQGPAPAGAEFRVHASTLGTQEMPDVFFQPDGGFVVVWGDGDGNGFGIRARRYDRAGSPVGAEFQVNTYTTNQQRFYGAAPRHVAGDAKGRFVVAWVSYGQDGDGDGVFARRYDAGGVPLGPEFQVTAYTTDDQTGVTVAMAPDGRFVLAWDSVGQDGSLSGVFARRYDASGAAVGAEFQVNQYTTSGQLAPDVALRPDGSFTVVWMSAQDGSGNSVHGRLYGAAGAPLGPEFRVNTTTASSQTFPVIAATPAGFVVAWESDFQDGSDDGIYAQRFDAAGVRVGAEFRVNTYTTTRQAFPAIVADASGRFAIAWESLGQDGAVFGVYGQRFDAQGLPRGGEFRINTATAGSQMTSRVASDRVGNVLAAWEGPDGSGGGAFAQRYGGLRPEAFAVQDGENGVLDVPDDFGFVTTWRNVSGSTQSFQGAATDHVVPSGLLLTLGNTATYGPVPDGAAGSCGMCFSGALLGTRPAGHVDLSFLETLQPDGQGQAQRWVAHVGGSFSDVFRTNPFYRYVETLLHRGITGGCSTTQYCPGNPTTREQMAVFVLVAKEGSGYAPPPCSPPNLFGDVPDTSAFCRFIEELAARGVVSGCQASPPLYCPFSPVTREQMAVFVLRTLDPALSPPACVSGSEMFADVPVSSAFCRWIEELARRGVVTGCGGGNYCPANPVTREQMGVFIGVTFGLTLYGV